MSTYGEWGEASGLPYFDYAADQRTLPQAGWSAAPGAPTTDRHWLAVGNRRLQLVVDNEGTTGIWEESRGPRWVIAPNPGGTGVSLVGVGGTVFGTAREVWPDGVVPRRRFLPNGSTVSLESAGLSLERRTWLPEGEGSIVVVDVVLRNLTDRPLAPELREEWQLAPRFALMFRSDEERVAAADKAVDYRVTVDKNQVMAREIVEQLPPFEPPDTPLIEESTEAAELLRGQLETMAATYRVPTDPSLTLTLSGNDDRWVAEAMDEGRYPLLRLRRNIRLEPGSELSVRATLSVNWGQEEELVSDGEGNDRALRVRLPHASSAVVPEVAREVPWHAALLSGGACRDEVLGDHTLNQGSAYGFEMGFNAAARDPLQHAMPLVYTEPDLALSVLRNTCVWSNLDGDLGYGLDSAKQPWTSMFQPSDSALWAMWLSAEYAAGTGDLAAFDQLLPCHPAYGEEQLSLWENLARQLDFLEHGIGRGRSGHVRLRNADWNDLLLTATSTARDEMIDEGESTLNSAMAAWILPIFAGLARRRGDTRLADRADALAGELRAAVSKSWNGRWFVRGYTPDGTAIGDEALWLEVQPWAILCGAATDEQATELLKTIAATSRKDSPLGARVRWPAVADGMFGIGEGFAGGVWFAINGPLIWAASRYDADLAWDEFRRMSLSNHTEQYPDIWEGTLSGPDAYNAPEADRPGRTFVGMQAFPVNNLHSHAQPLLAYLRLLGVEPRSDGALAIAGGRGSFESRTLTVAEDGTGRLDAIGEVTVHASSGRHTGGPGLLTF